MAADNPNDNYLLNRLVEKAGGSDPGMGLNVIPVTTDGVPTLQDLSGIPVFVDTDTDTSVFKRRYNANFVAIGASENGVIPNFAASWSFILLTGTCTLNGVSIPLNTPISGGPLLVDVAYTTGTSSSAFLAYESL